MDKQVLVHEFEYHEYVSTDRSHNAVYKKPETVKHCRVDYTSVYSRNNQEKVLEANGIIFCYAEHTTPFKMYKKQSKVVINGQEHIIEKVVPVSHPYSSELFAIELEVI